MVTHGWLQVAALAAVALAWIFLANRKSTRQGPEAKGTAKAAQAGRSSHDG